MRACFIRPIALCAALMTLTGMASAQLHDPATPPAVAAKIALRGEANGIAVREMRIVRKNDILTVQADLSNMGRSDRTMFYRFRWLDSVGSPVGDGESWKQIGVLGLGQQTIKSVAPTNVAIDLRLEITVPAAPDIVAADEPTPPRYVPFDGMALVAAANAVLDGRLDETAPERQPHKYLDVDVAYITRAEDYRGDLARAGEEDRGWRGKIVPQMFPPILPPNDNIIFRGLQESSKERPLPSFWGSLYEKNSVVGVAYQKRMRHLIDFIHRQLNVDSAVDPKFVQDMADNPGKYYAGFTDDERSDLYASVNKEQYATAVHRIMQDREDDNLLGRSSAPAGIAAAVVAAVLVPMTYVMAAGARKLFQLVSGFMNLREHREAAGAPSARRKPQP